MGQLVVQQFVTADGFAADKNNEFKAFELLDGAPNDQGLVELRYALQT